MTGQTAAERVQRCLDALDVTDPYTVSPEGVLVFAKSERITVADLRALLTEVEQLRRENERLTAAIREALELTEWESSGAVIHAEAVLAAALDRPSPEQETAR